MDDWARQQQALIQGGAQTLGIAYQPPTLTKREALTQRRDKNQREIERLMEQNGQIAEALDLLASAPQLERLDNLIVKVLGR